MLKLMKYEIDLFFNNHLNKVEQDLFEEADC